MVLGRGRSVHPIRLELGHENAPTLADRPVATRPPEWRVCRWLEGAVDHIERAISACYRISAYSELLSKRLNEASTARTIAPTVAGVENLSAR